MLSRFLQNYQSVFVCTLKSFVCFSISVETDTKTKEAADQLKEKGKTSLKKL